MALDILKITELGLEYYVLEKVPPQMGKSHNISLKMTPLKTNHRSPFLCKTIDFTLLDNFLRQNHQIPQ